MGKTLAFGNREINGNFVENATAIIKIEGGKNF